MLTMPIRIRQSRRAVRLSQAQLARQVGVCRSAVAQWERAHGTAPTVVHLAEIASITGVTFEWLATGRGAMRMGADEDVPAVETGDFARDELETRVLESLRRLPNRQRAMVCRIVDSLRE